MKLSRFKPVLILTLFTIFVAACSQTPSTSSTSSQSQPAASSTAASTPEAASSTETAPSTEAQSSVAVDEEKLQELLTQFKEKTPEGETPDKVVTVSVSISELLNELGVIPVGVPTTSSQLPAAFDQVPRIGSSHQPDLEQIAKLQPDFVLGPASIKDNLDKLFKSASLPSAYLPADSLDELKLSMVTLGRLFKKEDKAEAFLQQFNEKENAVIEKTKGKEAPSVMILFGSAESLMFMNENTYTGSLVKKLGASNVVTDVLKLKETYIPLNMESIVAANPDVILLVAHGDPDAVAKKFEEDTKKNGAWEKLDAFKNDKLIALDYSLFGIASIVKAPQAYEEMFKILYN
ncbi:iron complex transport system substrate-binding protein [Paenibacillus uliginis N3/975]|uniref:Iron complex transport system substrate-binding protein n=1 Tax=Paenibacillus uliginis N3/975 TaxID=1313296 RepID=A0A1X7H118_9BACL|nr:helical backbone metal receptor [Paenibacillus uliginis]SMF77742.1 iron complex transport system substrate-binding protein [Paenibacillus uliginis N3/975]